MGVEVREMRVDRTPIDGLLVITMKQVTDDRGTVREFFRQSSWNEHGLPDLGPAAQLNLTETRRGAIRGLHGESMTKLVAIAAGGAFGAYVDQRSGSPSFGSTFTILLAPGTQILVPQGVCNGFQSLSDGGCQYLYSFNAEWVPGMAGTALNPLDPAFAIEWPIPVDVDDPSLISAKDATVPFQ